MLNIRTKGLVNLGNTCYINVILQTMFKCKAFNDYVLGTAYTGTLLNCYKTIYKCTINKQKKSTILRPIVFIKKFRSLFQMFAMNQQDANEGLHFLLENIHQTFLKEESENNKLLLEEERKTLYKLMGKKDKSIIDTFCDDLKSKNEYSVMNKFFHGVMINTVTCNDCGHKVRKLESFGSLDLSIKNSSNLIKMLECHFIEEELDGYRCDGCSETNCVKKMKIVKLPVFLFIPFKRFVYKPQINNFIKIGKNINFPIFVDLQEYMITKNKKSIHKLSNVVNHLGGNRGGHYTSFHKDGHEWVSADDSDIYPCEEEEIFTQSAYILTYEHFLTR